MIKITHLQDQGIYHFVLPYGIYTVNGQEIEGGHSTNKGITSKTLPQIKRVDRNTEITHYEYEGRDITLEQYEALKSELTSKGVWDEDEYEFVFEDLDDEYAFKKFIRAAKPVTKQTRTETLVETLVTHAMLESDSEYITPMFSLDSNKADLVVFNKAALERDTLTKWCAENGVVPEIPTHSHLRFAKINGDYVFNDEFNEKNPVLTVSFDRAQELLKTVPERVLSRLRNSVKTVKESGIKVNGLLDRLDAIRRECSQQANARTPNRHVAFVNVGRQIGNLVEELKTITQ